MSHDIAKKPRANVRNVIHDPTHDDRAARIESVLSQYKANGLGEAGTSDDSTVSDLLADIRHYCDREDLDFGVLDNVAYTNYIEEIG